MNEDQDKTGTNRWVYCYWQEKFEILGELPRRAGLVVPGVLILPPPVGDLALAEGLWTALNRELGTMIDVAEEEDLSVDQIAAAVAIVRRFADRIRSDSELQKRVVGRQTAPDRLPLVASLPTSVLAGHLESLSEFLKDAGLRRQPVTISL